jgi:hypothetical protein
VSNPYREKPVYHVAHLSPAEVKAAILRFVEEKSSVSFEGAEVIFDVTRPNERSDYVVAAQVKGPDVDQS